VPAHIGHARPGVALIVLRVLLVLLVLLECACLVEPHALLRGVAGISLGNGVARPTWEVGQRLANVSPKLLDDVVLEILEIVETVEIAQSVGDVSIYAVWLGLPG
jgi:hypothetical protein